MAFRLQLGWLLVPVVLAACAEPFDPAVAVEGTDDRVIRVPGSDVEVAVREDGSYTVTLDEQRQIEVDQPDVALHLAGGSFDPLVARPAAVPGLDDARTLGADEPRLYVVQFVTQPLEAYRAHLRTLGATVHQYLPSQSHLVKMTPAVAALAGQQPWVRWVGEFRASWRMESRLVASFAARETLPRTRYHLHALEATKAAKDALAARLVARGATVHAVPSGGYLLQASLDGAGLAEIAGWADVVYVDTWSAPEVDMNLAREISGANHLEEVAGYTGQGVRGEVMDGNVYDTHVDFASRPILFHGERSGSKFHGTATTGIVFGDGTGDAKGRGMLPSAQPIFASYDHVTDRYAHTKQLLEEPYRALFQSNSWGDARTTAYTNISADMDKILFDHDILILQSQSNAGNQQSRPQAWSKNLLSVGAVNHKDTLDWADDAWARGASIGPAADGRIKPDLAHFYDRTWSPWDGGGYDDFSGTSGATPIVAGYAGLMFQMWGEGLFGPTRAGETLFDRRPHATTAKALLINTARSYLFTGDAHDLTRTHQGWGFPDLKRMHEQRASFVIVDESDVLALGGRTQHRVEVAAGAPELRATLTWSDPPGVPAAARARVNDLSLRVVSPSGVEYWGNAGLRVGNASSPGGAADAIDTVENVWVPAPEAGEWIIEVRADEINQDGHVETPEVDADYALVVSPVEPSGQPEPLGHLVIGQVAYDMPGNDTLEEWIELYNPTDEPVTLTGWRLRDDYRTFRFPAGLVIAPGAWLSVARDAAAFTALTGKTPGVAGSRCSLGNTGDRLSLVDPAGAVVDFVAWENGRPEWTALVARRGQSIVRKDLVVDTDGVADWKSQLALPH